MSNQRHSIRLEMIKFSFFSILFFQMQQPTNLEENTRSPRRQRQKISFKWTNPKQRKKQTRMLLHRKIEGTNDMQWNLFDEDKLENSFSNQKVEVCSLNNF
jgi:hypothetical protein